MSAPCQRFILTVLILLCCNHVFAWDEGDFEIFDAVEEINQNFYDFLEVPADASSKQIRKAYRQLTLKHHPDKSKEEESEVKFRNLVTVYDILKNEDKRKRYDQVLVEGMPDWRQPVFYYRRVRKMGMGELFILLSGIGTLGQYLTSWAVYIEKKLVVLDVFESKRKREIKKLKKSKAEGVVDDILQEEINAIPRPQLIDLWPILLVKFLYSFILSSPQNSVILFKYVQEKLREKFEKVEEELEDEEEDDEVFEKRPKKKPELPEYNPDLYETGCAVSYTPVLPTDTTNTDDQITIKKTEWTEEDTILLAKLVNKFPGGTPKRWNKIAEMMGRPVEEVTSRQKKAKDTYTANLTSVNTVDNIRLKGGNISKKGSEISDNIITHGETNIIETTKSNQNNVSQKSDNIPKDSLDKKRHKITNPEKLVERTKIITEYRELESSGKEDKNVIKLSDGESWTQNQQMILEWALRQHPKGTELRWEKISEHIPGKTKEDCVARFKHLAEVVKKRKTTTT